MENLLSHSYVMDLIDKISDTLFKKYTTYKKSNATLGDGKKLIGMNNMDIMNQNLFIIFILFIKMIIETKLM